MKPHPFRWGWRNRRSWEHVWETCPGLVHWTTKFCFPHPEISTCKETEWCQNIKQPSATIFFVNRNKLESKSSVLYEDGHHTQHRFDIFSAGPQNELQYRMKCFVSVCYEPLSVQKHIGESLYRYRFIMSQQNLMIQILSLQFYQVYMVFVIF